MKKYQILTLSAQSEEELRSNIQQLIDALKSDPGLSLADLARSLNPGEPTLAYRKVFVCREAEEAIELLEASKGTKCKAMAAGRREIVLMFPGQGSQYTNMLAGIYDLEPIFRSVVDDCLGITKRLSGVDLRNVLFFKRALQDGLNEIDHIQYAHSSLFIMEYALARLLISWGIKPDFLIGHSIGEYVAACISEAFSLEDALRLVMLRSQLIQRSKMGKMLAVSIPEQDLLSLLVEYRQISLAAVNSSELCVVSGNDDDIIAFQKITQKKGFSSQLIRTSHASHSYMMDDIIKQFEDEVRKVKIGKPKIPFVSNLTGKIATYDEICNPAYWSKHLRHTVRFADGASLLMKDSNRLFVEVGPGNTLGTFVCSNNDFKKTNKVIYTVRHEEKTADDLHYLLLGLGKLWLHGAGPDWQSFNKNELVNGKI
jgi:iturin family lipopeptide synthetase A